MKLLKFHLYGKTAHFKRPDVNSYAYFTYGHMPKPTLIGMLGAIIGLEGYKAKPKAVKKAKESAPEIATDYPEFYEKLKNLGVAIVPARQTKGYFAKKIHTFNNSVGYASKEEGGNLIVKEQWLEDVHWDIYLNLEQLDPRVAEKLSNYLLTGQAVYLPYLGKNDHFANISQVAWVEASLAEEPEQIDSLYKIEAAVLQNSSIDISESPYLYKDHFPKGLVPTHNFYEYHELAFTNREVFEVVEGHEFFEVEGKIIYLF